MSNVVPFRQEAPRPAPDWQARLLGSFACQRRAAGDVYWLKENAEVLGILARLGARPKPDALAPYVEFYRDLPNKAQFFPQYYRFFLSICLDLEDLGIAGLCGGGGAQTSRTDQGAHLAHWVHGQGLAQAELSDLQRAEAANLLARRGVMTPDAGLHARLMNFIARPQGFAIPNKKAAYELTHIVFYLSRYGTQAAQLPDEALQSLEFAGTLAFLECDFDLLAEICLALRFGGRTPSPLWEAWLTRGQGMFRAVPGTSPGAPTGTSTGTSMGGDAYHPFLLGLWWADVAGAGVAPPQLPSGAFRIDDTAPRLNPMRLMSECLYQMGGKRSASWRRMRRHVIAALDHDSARHLGMAEIAAPDFDRFFSAFARAAPMPMSDGKRRATAAGAGGIGVVDHKPRADQLF